MAGDQSHSEAIRTVWRTTLILAIVTIVEVVGVLVYPDDAPKMLVNLFVIILTLMKAYYIVAEFMHMKYEYKNLVLTILIPCLFFIWFIIAFLWDGASWFNLQHHL
jgi:cytochrome c oxidase subunit IV